MPETRFLGLIGNLPSYSLSGSPVYRVIYCCYRREEGLDPGPFSGIHSRPSGRSGGRVGNLTTWIRVGSCAKPDQVPKRLCRIRMAFDVLDIFIFRENYRIPTPPPRPKFKPISFISILAENSQLKFIIF